jgi:hypothetical protein
MAQLEEEQHHLGVCLLACYVADDTDCWGDGPICWWYVPAKTAQSPWHESWVAQLSRAN